MVICDVDCVTLEERAKAGKKWEVKSLNLQRNFYLFCREHNLDPKRFGITMIPATGTKDTA